MTRLRLVETERLTFWSARRGETDLEVACPHCGAIILWLQSVVAGSSVAYERTEKKEEEQNNEK